MTFISSNETRSPCEGGVNCASGLGHGNVTMLWEALWHWKLETKIRRLGLGFFPKIYALAQLELLLVLERQSSSQSALSQWSLLAMEIYENKQNTNNTLEAYFVKTQQFQYIYPITNSTSCVVHLLALLSVYPRTRGREAGMPSILPQPSTHSHLDRRASRIKAICLRQGFYIVVNSVTSGQPEDWRIHDENQNKIQIYSLWPESPDPKVFPGCWC